MRVWANRMGPILAKRIGHHQRGFIPTRDGRENIINVQLLFDLFNAKNVEGAIIFLDQEDDCPFLIFGVDEVDEELNIYNVLPAVPRWNESALMSYPFCKDRPILLAQTLITIL